MRKLVSHPLHEDKSNCEEDEPHLVLILLSQTRPFLKFSSRSWSSFPFLGFLPLFSCLVEGLLPSSPPTHSTFMRTYNYKMGRHQPPGSWECREGKIGQKIKQAPQAGGCAKGRVEKSKIWNFWMDSCFFFGLCHNKTEGKNVKFWWVEINYFFLQKKHHK